MARLKDKVAFITGAGSGIGRSAAQLFSREGAKVVVAELHQSAGGETVRLIQEAGGEAFPVETDVREPASVEAAIRASVAQYGKLDILYNNAGGSAPSDGKVTETAHEEFWRAIKLDLFGTWLCCHYGIPKLIEAGGGSVINAASIVAILGNPGKDAYTAAKGGIVALTRSMAAEYAGQGVRVNAVAPAATRTERVMRMLQDDAVGRELLSRHLLGLPEPLDVAHAALFLASDEARMITGHVLPVDSGMTAA